MPILYENPAEVGADRIVNAIAAYEQFGGDAGAPLIVVRLRNRDDASMRSRRRASIWAAPSAPACRFRPTRCFSARRACRGSTCASRRASSAARRSAPWSRDCSTATSGMVEGLVRADERRARRPRHVRRDRRARAAHRARDAIGSIDVTLGSRRSGRTVDGLENADVGTESDCRRTAGEIETYLCRKNDGT